jgi:hypothetical protein
VRTPNSPELRGHFSWVQPANQTGLTGAGFPEARMSVLYDLLNRVELDGRLEASRVGEVVFVCRVPSRGVIAYLCNQALALTTVFESQSSHPSRRTRALPMCADPLAAYGFRRPGARS